MNTDLLRDRLTPFRQPEWLLLNADDQQRLAKALYDILLELHIPPVSMYGIGMSLCKLTF